MVLSTQTSQAPSPSLPEALGGDTDALPRRVRGEADRRPLGGGLAPDGGVRPRLLAGLVGAPRGFRGGVLDTRFRTFFWGDREEEDEELLPDEEGDGDRLLKETAWHKDSVGTPPCWVCWE